MTDTHDGKTLFRMRLLAYGKACVDQETFLLLGAKTPTAKPYLRMAQRERGRLEKLLTESVDLLLDALDRAVMLDQVGEAVNAFWASIGASLTEPHQELSHLRGLLSKLPKCDKCGAYATYLEDTFADTVRVHFACDEHDDRGTELAYADDLREYLGGPRRLAPERLF